MLNISYLIFVIKFPQPYTFWETLHVLHPVHRGAFWVVEKGGGAHGTINGWHTANKRDGTKYVEFTRTAMETRWNISMLIHQWHSKNGRGR